MARNEYQFIVIKRSKIVFIGTAVECADIVGIKSAGYIHQYAKRFHSYNGYYFVKLPDGIKTKKKMKFTAEYIPVLQAQERI